MRPSKPGMPQQFSIIKKGVYVPVQGGVEALECWNRDPKNQEVTEFVYEPCNCDLQYEVAPRAFQAAAKSSQKCVF